MGELDYQMALLLQHRFEQEYKGKKNDQKSDYELARTLQEQFETEYNIDKPSTSLVYDHKKKGVDSSKSLTDPSWELVDPTPDIYTLFMAFNQRFFWNKLVTVCVSWSKRMTTCAGICSYSGRGGMCSITLSEPLLKLRPRKDLVETLLHEMIHAYLFVTHNNKDRDGHGPEFHRHMFRINKESGTNITVYHNFHDEVRLYKQHWWRCNGPCQHRRPYFGMVRRATNRAPGPNDRWWAEHSRICGGTFIKVKEPEKKTKSKEKNKSGDVMKSGDIRNFIPALRNNVSGTSNVKGFKDLANKVKGKYNSTSTIVITNTKNTNAGANTSSFQPTIYNKDANQPNSVRIGSASSECTDDFLSVRNHWQNKFNNTNNKRPSSSLEQESKSKISKTDSVAVPSETYASCPVCNQKILISESNHHLDLCLKQEDKQLEIIDLTESQSSDFKECPVCDTKIMSSRFENHLENCLSKICDDAETVDNDAFQDKEIVSCLACGKKILKEDLNTHLEDCMCKIFDVEVDSGNSNEDNKEGSETQFNCPFCLELVNENAMKKHIDFCLNTVEDSVVKSMTDDF